MGAAVTAVEGREVAATAEAQVAVALVVAAKAVAETAQVALVQVVAAVLALGKRGREVAVEEEEGQVVGVVVERQVAVQLAVEAVEVVVMVVETEVAARVAVAMAQVESELVAAVIVSQRRQPPLGSIEVRSAFAQKTGHSLTTLADAKLWSSGE